MIIISYELLGVKKLDSTEALEKLKPVFGASSTFDTSPTAVLVFSGLSGFPNVHSTTVIRFCYSGGLFEQLRQNRIAERTGTIIMGRQAIFDLLRAKAFWPPVVVPFGLDPFGWHGSRESYGELCEFALRYCTLLPKVYPLDSPLCLGEAEVYIESVETEKPDGGTVREHRLIGGPHRLSMEEIRDRGEMSWKTSKRWIETEDDFTAFLSLDSLQPAIPDIAAVREKEQQVGEHGLPYAEVNDPFSVVSEMFPTEIFYIKTVNDRDRVDKLIDLTAQRILSSIRNLCRDTRSPFILRLIGSEKAVPPFMSRDDFLHFEGDFYTEVVEIASKHDVPVAFHCHGPVRDILSDIWSMGCSIVEPFEPPPRGNLSISEALELTAGRGVVFGGIDDVLLSTGSSEDVRRAVQMCLDGARNSGRPFILSQSATPFFDPLSEKTKKNLLLFLELSVKG